MIWVLKYHNSLSSNFNMACRCGDYLGPLDWADLLTRTLIFASDSAKVEVSSTCYT